MSEAALIDRLQVGDIARTRDRREARITRLDPAAGRIEGEVQMHGACRWRADGVFADAPFGAPGPLDLLLALPPGDAAKTERGSLRDALQSGEGRPFCCD